MKDGGLTEDENRKLHDEIQELLKEYEEKMDRCRTRRSPRSWRSSRGSRRSARPPAARRGGGFRARPLFPARPMAYALRPLGELRGPPAGSEPSGA